MPAIDRRTILSASAGAALARALPAHAQTIQMKLLLNTSLSGPVAFFLLAEDRGYLREAGLDIAFTGGDGAAAVVPKVVHGAFDIGYGDMTALIERIARGRPNEGPVAIYTTFNTVPFTIAVAASGPIRTPRDLEGRTISGHPVDAALITFDMFAKATGIDAAKVKILKLSDAMGAQVAETLKGRQADGVFGFVNTIIAAVTPLGIDPATIRFLTYAEHLPDMYGNTLFVTRETYRDRRAALPGLVRAVNRALADTVTDPKLATDALLRRAPGASREVNHTRLVGTLKSEMAHPEGRRLGIGDMDDARLGRLIRLVVEAKKLPRLPEVREVFDRGFLPPEGERIRTLG